jgi:hypothetical protein
VSRGGADRGGAEPRMVELAELAGILGVSRTEARRLAGRAWRSHRVAYTKLAPGRYAWPLEALLAAIASESGA